jgi:uncharacterized repeat protein (TIGR03803 family)
VGNGNTFYGTTLIGGIGGYGTVFRFTTDGSFTTIYSFGTLDARTPYAGVTKNHKLYGVTAGGGAYDQGAIYSVTRN